MSSPDCNTSLACPLSRLIVNQAVIGQAGMLASATPDCAGNTASAATFVERCAAGHLTESVRFRDQLYLILYPG